MYTLCFVSCSAPFRPMRPVPAGTLGGTIAKLEQSLSAETQGRNECKSVLMMREVEIQDLEDTVAESRAENERLVERVESLSIELTALQGALRDERHSHEDDVHDLATRLSE